MRKPVIQSYSILPLVLFTITAAFAQDKAGGGPDFEKLLLPANKTHRFTEDNYYIWCGTMVKTPDDTCHLFYSRWPKAKGFDGWVTDSEIAHAVSDNPSGPYKFQNVALPKREKNYWDADVTHNPTVMQFGKKYYLYYMGNYGDGAFWNHRNHQRIGVAIASHPGGPWKRLDKPLIDVTVNAWDHLMTSNPSVTKTNNGKYLLVYKGVADGPLPKGGKVSHGMAISSNPAGPFVKQPNKVFDVEGSQFAAEDPFIWRQMNTYYAIVKDMKGAFTNRGTSLALFRSDDGLNWQLSSRPFVSDLVIKWTDSTTQKVQRLERPQLWLENGKPAALFVAVKENDSTTYNLAIPLKNN